jgi:glycosyltransferase involved in cell wall biosynthesis
LHANVTICAPFRDSSKTVGKFIGQAQALSYPVDSLRFVVVEGDSQDDTWARLHEWAIDDYRVTLATCDTGAPLYGSIVHPERFATLARVFNTALDAVDLTWSDYVLFTPSDVCFAPDTLARLLAHGKDMVSPMFWRNGIYYDTWASIYQGNNFTNFTKAWAQERFQGELLEMDSIGGMMLMCADVLRSGCRYTTEDVDRGLCQTARKRGFTCWMDTATHIVHR